jgi:hypothetical protein
MPSAPQQALPTVEPTEIQDGSGVALSARSHPDSQSTQVQQPNPALFQAIGIIYGTPERNDTGKFFVCLDGQSYGLFIRSHRYIPWLKQIEQNEEKPLYLRVYPKCLIIPNQMPIIQFELLFWALENRWIEEPGQPNSQLIIRNSQLTPA